MFVIPRLASPSILYSAKSTLDPLRRNLWNVHLQNHKLRKGINAHPSHISKCLKLGLESCDLERKNDISHGANKKVIDKER